MGMGKCAFCDSAIHYKDGRLRVVGIPTNGDQATFLEFCTKEHLVLFFIEGHYEDFDELDILEKVKKK